MHALAVENLTHDYQTGFWRKRAMRALDGLSLQVEAGEVFGFLGPNGAGKTTTFKILMRLITPTAGDARILDRPLDDLQMRRRIGYLPEQPYFYDYLTAREFLLYCGALCDLPRDEARRRAAGLLERVGLGDSGEKHLRRFSRGMLQRLGLAQALINDPEILFLDEPMSALDPLGRREVRDLIAGLRARGKTIFFSSHILTDVEAMCDRVAILSGGKLVEEGKLSDILKSHSNEIEAVVSGVSEDAFGDLREFAVDVAPTPEGARVRLRNDHDITRLLAIAHRNGGRLVSINPVRESLEELFVREVSESSRRPERGSYNRMV
jgi:ABC-2 type transport system ATP-binding protein